MRYRKSKTYCVRCFKLKVLLSHRQCTSCLLKQRRYKRGVRETNSWCNSSLGRPTTEAKRFNIRNEDEYLIKYYLRDNS